MKLLTILGARPQFIKAAAVSRAIKECEDINEVIVHTGQHFDENMSDVFFRQLNIPDPKYHLKVASMSHGVMTARMLEKIEELLLAEKPDWVMVYGDTNSTLAGALAAAKLHVPIVHVEAGLRSYRTEMPEEINRVLTDRVSTLLLCPSAQAVSNLIIEGYPNYIKKIDSGSISQHIENVGDVMFDVVLHYKNHIVENVDLGQFQLLDKRYAICTLHRQENADNIDRLKNIFFALKKINTDCQVVMPLHPRTRKKLDGDLGRKLLDGIKVIDPQPYFEMQRLMMGAYAVLTDSGGIQKEAYFHKVPCITLREETEWVETVSSGWNQVAGTNMHEIVSAFNLISKIEPTDEMLYGYGDAATKIVKAIKNMPLL